MEQWSSKRKIRAQRISILLFFLFLTIKGSKETIHGIECPRITQTELLARFNERRKRSKITFFLEPDNLFPRITFLEPNDKITRRPKQFSSLSNQRLFHSDYTPKN